MISLPAGVTFGTASIEKIHEIWNKIKNFDKLFTDDVRWDEEWFFKRIYAPDTVFLEIDEGIILITDKQDGLLASAHLVFWDHKLSARTNLVKECLKWTFIQYNLQRIEIITPEFTRALRRFIEDRLGFKFEGRLRSRMWYMGNLCDCLVYSILRTDDEMKEVG